MKSLVSGSARAPLLVSLLVLGAMLASCSKDPPPKPTTDESKKTTPVPSDMVFNDFMPSGGGQVGLRVDGGGLEAGLAAVAGDGGAAGEPAAGGAEGEDPALKLKVVEPGAEPRAVRKYTFATGKGEKRLLTMKQSAEGGGGPQDMTFVLLLEVTPKAATPRATKFEMKVLKVEIPGVPAAQKAQADAQLGVFAGLKGTFDVGPLGEVGEVDFKADEKMQNGAAALILNSLSQAVELMVPQFPSEPIGVGAKWERNVERKERGVEQTQKHTFTLKELTDGGGVVTVDTNLKVGKRPLQARGVPPGATQEVSAKGTQTYHFKLDRIATKVEGEIVATEKIEAPDGKGGKQSATQVSKVKNTMEAPK